MTDDIGFLAARGGLDGGDPLARTSFGLKSELESTCSASAAKARL